MEQSQLNLLIPLSEDGRNAARKQADRDMIAALGPPPKRPDFQDKTISRYPFWLLLVVGFMLFLVLGAAANISMFRVFKAGQDHYLQSIDVQWQADLVGASTFVMAEFMVIVCTLAMSVFYDDDDPKRWWMAVPIALGLAMAFVGNWTVTRPHTIFGWLETAGPPTAVLFMGIIAELLTLSALARRRGNEAAYQEARQEYDAQAASPRDLDGWLAAYMRRLKEVLYQVNSKGRGTKERTAIMQEMTNADWVTVVQRELAEDAVWEMAAAAIPINPTEPVIPPPEQKAQPVAVDPNQEAIPIPEHWLPPEPLEPEPRRELPIPEQESFPEPLEPEPERPPMGFGRRLEPQSQPTANKPND